LLKDARVDFYFSSQLAMKLLEAYSANCEYGKACEVAENWRSKLSVCFSQDASEKLAILEDIRE